MKLRLLINIPIIFLSSLLSAQVKIDQTRSSTEVIELKIKPSATDPTIKAADTAHLILYKPNIRQGKLLLFLPGTNGIATKGPRALFNTAMEQGYRVINLSYINYPAGSTTCFGETLANDPDCIEKFRIKRIYGENTTPLFPDEPQDAIINRFTKLLLYLRKFDPKGNWEKYLKNDEVNWQEIALSGQSQGGGMSAYIAKKTLVWKVISFSGGWDYSAKGQLATWYFRESVTPQDRWFGIYHVEEPKAITLLGSYKAMAIPPKQIYHLDLPVNQNAQAHGQGISNIAYKPQWIEILGRGN